jgi:hypothetical protein
LIGLRDAECRRHVADLTALAAQLEPAPGRGDVLDHVERCARCALELQDLSLAAVALRRLGDVPDPEWHGRTAWLRLQARIERSRASAAALAWRWRTTLAGLAASTLVVAALVAPVAFAVRFETNGAERVGYEPRELELLNRHIEASYIAGGRTGTLSTIPDAAASPAGIQRRYPDEIIPEMKEVQSRPSGHPLTAD